MADESIPRRHFLKGAAVAGTTAAAAALTPVAPAAAQQTHPGAASKPAAPSANGADAESMLTLTATEAAFFSAVADTMVPADALSPSGTECGIVTFIDRQLAGAWGGGAKMYRNGPFRKAKPEYGYQLPLTPREFFATGVVATNAWATKTYGKDFDRLSAKQREQALTVMEQGKAELADFNGKDFFEALLQITMEGFFSDPIYGGNKDKVSWKMIGYPGLPATYANQIEQYRNKLYKVEPQSIADFS
ncbi:MAG: gluconate 2-dehydrogenase subunit 3 family protein [Xanthobacteraceae bacterium]